MSERVIDAILEAMDEYAVSTQKVQSVTGMSNIQINRAVKSGEFPMPVMELHGVQYWRLGDMYRFEIGCA